MNALGYCYRAKKRARFHVTFVLGEARNMYTHVGEYPSRDSMLILQDLAGFMRNIVNLTRYCKEILQDYA